MREKIIIGKRGVQYHIFSDGVYAACAICFRSIGMESRRGALFAARRVQSEHAAANPLRLKL